MFITALVAVIAANPPVVIIDRDNVQIGESCIVEIRADLIQDNDNNGVIHVVADGITIEFSDEHRELIAVAKGTPWDTLTGIGIRIDGHRNVTIRNAHVHRFKVGIYATNAAGLVLENCDVAGGYQHRLKSTPRAEDASDWLWPHDNDNNQWMTNYGAGIYVEDSDGITIRNCFARRRQNGIILDRVNDSAVYDNDCSFLSGWGLAMWRSSRNVVSRNAFDFCVRGYSHGVYNRGQDSAGLLMFEQCSDNIIVENSITHGGDGIFAFAGKEALGETPPPTTAGVTQENIDWYRGRGNNRNMFIANDCSYAVAHGIELTFSFNNTIAQNRLVSNAICGIWGGYSQNTTIAGNVFESNGDMPYGLERGGINIEHGRGNWIQANTFRNNACGVHLWWDPDEGLTKLPWAKVNNTDADRNVIYGNTFDGDKVAIQLRETSTTFVIANGTRNVGDKLRADAKSQAGILRELDGPPLRWTPPVYEPLGETSPVGARDDLAGRDKIIMTEWGPYDWQAPYLHLFERTPTKHVYRLLGRDNTIEPGAMSTKGDVQAKVQADRISITPTTAGTLAPYEISLVVDDTLLQRTGVLIDARWRIMVSGYETKPALKPDDPGPPLSADEIERRYVAWRGEITHGAVVFDASELRLRYGGAGPSQLDLAANVSEAALPINHFGTIATTRILFPAGAWRLRTTSDDGIRVRLDEELVIDDWTWHGPKEHSYEFKLDEARELTIRVEHFELDGYAILTLDIEAVDKQGE
ncbi:MAG: right-handed parallel beta-helix repeat-containing protein [Planctomycetes bacterium]|nr:right-handed parallel beta-helix repeat-containing protein [Planctomycetota bacterium]